MGPEVVGILALASFGLVVSVFGTRIALSIQSELLKPLEARITSYFTKRLLPTKTESVEAKLERVKTLGDELANLNSEITEEYKRSLAETARLQSEAEAAKTIASLNDEQARAVLAVLNEGEKKNRWFQVLVAFAFFVAGVFAAIFTPGLVNWIFPPN